MTEEQKAKVVDRIRKLLALSTSPNEHEAAVAAEKAQALLLEYDISMTEVRKDDSEALKSIAIDDSVITDSQPWRKPLANAVAQLYMCSYFFVNQRDGKTRHSFVGETQNTMVATMMFQYLESTVNRLAREGARKVPKNEQSPYRVSFRAGCVVRLCARIRERIEAAKRGEIKSETTGNTLPALASMYDRSKMLQDQFIEQQVGKLKTKSTALRTALHVQGGSDGIAAGNRIGLDQQVGGHRNHKAIR